MEYRTAVGDEAYISSYLHFLNLHVRSELSTQINIEIMRKQNLYYLLINYIYLLIFFVDCLLFTLVRIFYFQLSKLHDQYNNNGK